MKTVLRVIFPALAVLLTSGAVIAQPAKAECLAGAKPGAGFDLTCRLLANSLQATWTAAWVSGVVQAVVWWALFGPLIGGNLPKGRWGF